MFGGGEMCKSSDAFCASKRATFMQTMPIKINLAVLVRCYQLGSSKARGYYKGFLRLKTFCFMEPETLKALV